MAKEDRRDEIVFVDSAGKRESTRPSRGLELAVNLGITRPVVFQRFGPREYTRPYDKEVQEFTDGSISLGEMTPAYAHAMVSNTLKRACGTVKTFKDEMALARLWREKLTELCKAFDLPDDHISINTEGQVLHVYPQEVSGVSIGPNGLPLHFERKEGISYPSTEGRGFEAILPTHVQNSGYNTPAHPEMDSSLAAPWAIPKFQIGKYVRIGGAFNIQGSATLTIGDNAWIGQHSYFITQEHPAELPAQLARERSSTNFPGIHIGSWAWVAKEAKVLYRTNYIGVGAVVASQAKINAWVSDHSLVTTEGHQVFYPVKAFVLDTLGIRDTHEVLALDWMKVEELWQSEYQRWASEPHIADGNVAEAIVSLRDTEKAGRVLFIGSMNDANILYAADSRNAKNLLRRIDVMTIDQSKNVYIMQALNGMRNRNTRFRTVADLGEIPIGTYHQEQPYDLVVIEASAEVCCGDNARMEAIVSEAQRLVKPGGKIVGTLHDIRRFGAGIALPPYVTAEDTRQMDNDRVSIHIQNILT